MKTEVRQLIDYVTFNDVAATPEYVDALDRRWIEEIIPDEEQEAYMEAWGCTKEFVIDGTGVSDTYTDLDDYDYVQAAAM